MPLEDITRNSINAYCKRDLGDLQWHIDQFSFIANVDLQRKLGRAFYSARYVYKLMEALFATGDERHAFVKFQIMQYASIYEAVISYLLWNRYKNNPEVIRLQTHKAYKRVYAFASITSMSYDSEEVFPCVYRNETTRRDSIAFPDKVDCAIRIGFVEEKYSAEIKSLYKLRNLAHLETEAEKQIEVEIEQAKNGYWRMKPFLEKIVEVLSQDNETECSGSPSSGELV